MTTFPKLTDAFRAGRLSPRPGRLRAVLDTDTYNEIDDQFAVAYLLGSPERFSCEALYAAPFHNARSTGPGDGMEKSYDEIHRLLPLMNLAEKPPVFRGATRYLDVASPERTAVTDDLIHRAMNGPADEPLYVIAIGAITNIAAALLLEPRLVERTVVVWLGGHAAHWPDSNEFNLRQDIPAARVVLDSGVPLALFPCGGCVDRLMTTVPELQACLAGRSKLADYLVDIVANYEERKSRQVWAKVIWDIAPVAWLIDAGWTPSVLRPSPIITSESRWAYDDGRHLIRVARIVHRDPIFRDVFDKIAKL